LLDTAAEELESGVGTFKGYDVRVLLVVLKLGWLWPEPIDVDGWPGM